MKKRNIYINGRFLTQPLFGVQRYAYELCKALKELGEEFTIVMPQKDVQTCYDTKGWNIVKWGLGNSHLWEQLILPFFFLFKKNYCLVNFTGLGPAFVHNKVMTIHDLAFYENPKWYSELYVLFYKFLTPVCAKSSEAILTVSEFSKKEIIKWLHIDSEKIHVIYNSAKFSEVKGGELPGNIPEKYYLAVSSIDPRKNFERLINVFAKLPECNLVVVGGSYHVFTPIVLNSGYHNVTFAGRVSDETLASLYKKAFAFVYPSLYEGFGIPPIEAMTYGCPVIASGIDVLREVCGDAALYADPYNEEDIKEKVLTLYNSEALREELSKKGEENIKRFSWGQSASMLNAVLKSINE